MAMTPCYVAELLPLRLEPSDILARTMPWRESFVRSKRRRSTANFTALRWSYWSRLERIGARSVPKTIPPRSLTGVYSIHSILKNHGVILCWRFETVPLGFFLSFGVVCTIRDLGLLHRSWLLKMAHGSSQIQCWQQLQFHRTGSTGGPVFLILEHSLFILEVGRRTRSSFELPCPQVQVWGNDGSALPSPAPTNQVPNSWSSLITLQ